MTLTGGLRTRSIEEALTRLIREALLAAGWFNANQLLHDVRVSSTPAEDDDLIAPNLVTVYLGDSDIEDHEMGSYAVDIRMAASVEIFGESKAVTLHIRDDIRDALTGLSSTTFGRRSVPVFDYAADPDGEGTPEFYAQLTDVATDATRLRLQKWEGHYGVINFTVEDEGYAGI